MTPVALHAANPGPMTGSGNWTYLVGEREPVLIDAGVGHAAHLEAIAAAAPNGPARVLVTHAHADHVSGAAAVHERWPGAGFAKYPWPGRDPDLPWTPLADGDIVTTDAGELQAVHTPGHAPDHLAFWHAASRSVFVGDLLVLGSTVVILASQGGSLVAYLHSLERLRALAPVRAWPAHGPVIEDPLALIQHYIDHRAAREAQVLDALVAGGTIAEMVTVIYPGLTDALVPMARESVLAHLQKLEAEGRAIRDGARWAGRERTVY